MSRETDADPTLSVTRRQTIAGVGGVFGVALGSTSRARAQPTPETGTGEGALITRKALIPQVGQPFEGEYVGQFVLFVDPTPREDITPESVAECDFTNWPPEQTRGYEGLLIDRLTDEPRGVEVPMYLNENQPRIDVGNAFIVMQTHSCPGDVLGLELEEVPVETFAPEYGTVEHPLVGEEPGPTVSPIEDGQQPQDDGIINAPGQPGFGILAALAGIGGGALLRRLIRRI